MFKKSEEISKNTKIKIYKAEIMYSIKTDGDVFGGNELVDKKDEHMLRIQEMKQDMQQRTTTRRIREPNKKRK